MRALTLALALVAALPALAQPPPPASEARASLGQRVALGAAGVAGGLVATVATVDVLGSDADAPVGLALVLLSYPTGATLTVQALGPVIGTAPRWATTAQDVVLGVAGGALVGAVGVGVGFAVDAASETDEYLPVGLVLGSVVGGVVGVATAVVLTGRRVRVAPTALAAPTGRRVTGLSLRVGL